MKLLHAVKNISYILNDLNSPFIAREVALASSQQVISIFHGIAPYFKMRSISPDHHDLDYFTIFYKSSCCPSCFFIKPNK